MPLDSEFSLRVSRKASHPFLAEYDRKLTVIRSGRALGTLNYAKDTGGGFPMQVRFHADSTRRLVRVTDYLGDRLIDLHTGRYVDDQTPPEGKESSSAVRDATLPTLRRSVEIDRDMQVVQRDGAVMTVPPPALASNPAIALWLQSCALVGRVAELGSFVSGCGQQCEKMNNQKPGRSKRHEF